MKAKKIKELVTAKEMHLKYPKKFKVPSVEELNNIKAESIVLITTGLEIFWTVVTKIDGDTIYATIDGVTFRDTEYNQSDLLEFEKKYIFEVHKE